MRRSTWRCTPKTTYDRVEAENVHRSTWRGTGRVPENSYLDQPREYYPRKQDRKQYLCQLVSEFEKCAQQSEDVIGVRKASSCSYTCLCTSILLSTVKELWCVWQEWNLLYIMVVIRSIFFVLGGRWDEEKSEGSECIDWRCEIWK